VRPRSAVGDTGDETRLAFEHDQVLRLKGLHHLDLLNHPRVYAQLHDWLAGRDSSQRPPSTCQPAPACDAGH
jgi:hypothetical protein